MVVVQMLMPSFVTHAVVLLFDDAFHERYNRDCQGEDETVTFRLLPIFIASMTLGGCAASAVRAPEVRQSVTVAVPFTGTWFQVPKENDRGPSGFLAIDHDRLLFNLDGLPRGSIAITENDTDAGLRSGRLICADGRVLYIAVGETITEQQAGNQRIYSPTVHLDLHLFPNGSAPTDQPIAILRLWPSTALAALSIHSSANNQAPNFETLSPPAKSLDSADHRFIDVVKATRNGFLNTVVAQIISARSEGESINNLNSLYHRCTNLVRSDIVRELDAARLGDANALSRADQQSDDLHKMDTAFSAWRSQR
jgi:hypothetical protein